MSIPAFLGPETSARIAELGKAIRANTGARAFYRLDPEKNVLLIAQCTSRINDAMVELENIERVLDSYEAGAAQAAADEARS